MKKVILSMLIMVCSLSMMATQTSYVRIKLSGSDPTYSNSTLRLYEDDERTAAAEDGFDSPCMMVQSNDNSTLIYGLIGASEYSRVATNNLSDLNIGFKTNNIDANYTLKFEDFEGTEFTIYDLVAGKSITVNGSTPDYAFSVSPSQVGQVAINNRFVVNYVPAAEFACFKNKILEINDSPYAAGKIVIETSAGAGITGSPFDGDANVDLSSLPDDGARYVVKFFPTSDVTGKPAKQFVIVVPEVPAP